MADMLHTITIIMQDSKISSPASRNGGYWIATVQCAAVLVET